MRNLEILGKKFRRAVEEESIVKIDDAARISVARGHLLAAHENLQAMEAEEKFARTASNPFPHKKWIITKGYYAMYKAALSLLAVKGWTDKRSHEPVPIALKFLYAEDPSVANEIAKMAEILEDSRTLRQRSTYGLYPSREEIERGSKEIPELARKFVEKAEDILRRVIQ
ncbi:MAG: HEPN domain-containing protein [Hadesarchaea archaeon]|nr:HEPN domain-containing protein [Hadesarchaea archaeon]